MEKLEDRFVLNAAYMPGEVLVQYKNVSDDVRVVARNVVQGELKEAFRTPAMAAAGRGEMERIGLPAGMSVENAVQKLKNLPGIAYAEPNWVVQPSFVSNDPYYTTSGQLWGMYSDDSPTPVGGAGTTNQYGSQAEEAWNAGFIGDSSVYVGIIDEGFQYTHPDLADNSWTNPFDPVDGIDNDGNGYIDDVHGWDFFNNDNSTYDGTADDHGTHVAGTIGGKGGNGIGVAGVNWNVTMISTKFLGPTGGYTSGAIQALDYLTDLKVRHGINIVASNNSWGGGGFSQGLLDAITRAANQGILFVAAAGNSNLNNDVSASYPSNYNTTAGAGYDSVIAVAAIDSTGARASFSSYGASTVDLGAPGVTINSTLPTDTYGAYSGTSMATPHVTGAAALYAAANPGATANQIRAAILNSATPTASMSGKTVTGGRLNVSALMGNPVGSSLSINDVSITEGDAGTKVATFTVSLSSAASNAVTVDYATANGTATGGTDYGIASGSLSFAVGETTKTVDVTINGDTTVESDETFFVNLTNANGASISDGQGQGTIVNDDIAATPSLSIDDVSLPEGNSGTNNFVFTVTLSPASSQTVTVRYATQNVTASSNSDYNKASGTLTFSPGQTSKTITVGVRGDTRVESNETFNVNLSRVTNAVIADSRGVGTILDDDGSGPAGSGNPGGTIAGPGSIIAGALSVGESSRPIGLSPNTSQTATDNYFSQAKRFSSTDQHLEDVISTLASVATMKKSTSVPISVTAPSLEKPMQSRPLSNGTLTVSLVDLLFKG